MKMYKIKCSDGTYVNKLRGGYNGIVVTSKTAKIWNSKTFALKALEKCKRHADYLKKYKDKKVTYELVELNCS